MTEEALDPRTEAALRAWAQSRYGEDQYMAERMVIHSESHRAAMAAALAAADAVPDPNDVYEPTPR